MLTDPLQHCSTDPLLTFNMVACSVLLLLWGSCLIAPVSGAACTRGSICQLHLALGNPGELRVSWVSTDEFSVMPVVQWGESASTLVKSSSATTQSYDLDDMCGEGILPTHNPSLLTTHHSSQSHLSCTYISSSSSPFYYLNTSCYSCSWLGVTRDDSPCDHHCRCRLGTVLPCW
jgi:hypothetical protein